MNQQEEPKQVNDEQQHSEVNQQPEPDNQQEPQKIIQEENKQEEEYKPVCIQEESQEIEEPKQLEQEQQQEQIIPQYVQQEEQEVIAPQNNPEKEIQIVQEMQEEINMNQQQQQQQQQQQSSQQQYEQQQQQQYEQKQEVSQVQQQQVQQRVQPSLEGKINTYQYIIQDGEKQESQVYQYMAPWVIYSIGFSSKPNINYRIGIGSFLEEDINYVQIIKLNEMTQQFDEVFKFEHKYPPTKLMWIPDLDEKYPDILATSGESLKIYEINQESNNVFLKADLVNKSDFSAPLTSFDWNISKQNLIGTASIDTTCTIWDIEKETVYTQLIAHDKEVYDIAFAKDPNLFASVGADGSARQFDLRNLEHSTVLYDTENQSPLLKLGWNHLDPNYVAVIAMDQNDITILDTRMPQTPLAKLNNHKNCVNALAWAPSSCSHICTVADDCQALIWDILEIKPEITDPLLEYKAEQEIANLSWSLSQHDWLAIIFHSTLQILKV